MVNCNLQRLDGPVRGNGRIVDELERLFTGSGWNVIKLLSGQRLGRPVARDLTGTLVRTLGETVDGQMQTFAAKDGRYNRDHFFHQHPELEQLAQGMTDEQIDRLKRGGHDLVKIYAAYAAAATHRGQPTVILAHTKKGYGMGTAGQGKMTTHSQKKLDDARADRLSQPLSPAPDRRTGAEPGVFAARCRQRRNALPARPAGQTGRLPAPAPNPVRHRTRAAAGQLRASLPWRRRAKR